MRLSTLFLAALAALGLGALGGIVAARRAYDPRHEHFVPNNAERPRESISGTNTPLAQGPTPRVLVRNGERYDFGKMPRGSQGKHIFYVMNVGNAPLSLKKGQTTCICTLSALEEGAVAPGEVAAVTLEWTVKSDENYFSQLAELLTNDPERPVVQLRIEGYVEDIVRITPDELVFSNVASNETHSRQLFVYAARAEDNVRVEELSFLEAGTVSFFEAQVRDLTQEELANQPLAKAGQVVTVTLKPGMPTGEIQQSLKVKLNVHDMPEQIIPIRGNVQSDVSVVGRLAKFDPSSNLLVLGGVDQSKGTRAEMSILLKGDHRHQIQISLAEVYPKECLTVTLGEPRVGERLTTIPLTIEVKPGAPRVTRLGSDQGPLGLIVLKAENAVTKEVRINVQFSVF